MLWAALGTAGSVSSAPSGASAGSESGGRFRTGAGAASSPPTGRWPNGRYQTSVGLAASERPTSSASRGSSWTVSVSSATSGARAEPLDQRRELGGIVDHGDRDRGRRVEGEPVVGGQRRAGGRRFGAASASSVAAAGEGRRRGAVARGRGSGCTALPRQLPRQGVELQLGQDPDRGLLIGLLQGADGADVELDRHVALDASPAPARAARCRPARAAPRGPAWR